MGLSVQEYRMQGGWRVRGAFQASTCQQVGMSWNHKLLLMVPLQGVNMFE